MAIKRMGWEGKIYYGTAGSSAATEIGNSRDINENFEVEFGDTTERGTGTLPITTSRPVCRTYSLDWQMLKKESDTTLTALIAAATSGTAVAIKTVDVSGGVGFDGDVYLTMTKGKPLKGEQTLQFTGVPTDETRAPQLNS